MYVSKTSHLIAKHLDIGVPMSVTHGNSEYTLQCMYQCIVVGLMSLHIKTFKITHGYLYTVVLLALQIFIHSNSVQ